MVDKPYAIGTEFSRKLQQVGRDNIFFGMDARIEAKNKINGVIRDGRQRSPIIYVELQMRLEANRALQCSTHLSEMSTATIDLH